MALASGLRGLRSPLNSRGHLQCLDRRGHVMGANDAGPCERCDHREGDAPVHTLPGRPPRARVHGSVALAVIAALAGAHIVRAPDEIGRAYVRTTVTRQSRMP